MRPEGWDERLRRFVARRRRRPFVWGENDCALFAASAVRALTWRDPAEWFRGRYRTKAGATNALSAYVEAHELGAKLSGAGDDRWSMRLEAVATHLLGSPLDSPLFAQRGDVVALPGEDGRTVLGICLGATVAYPCLSGGLGEVLLIHGLKAWRV